MRLFLEVSFKNFIYFLTNKSYRTFYLLLIRLGSKKRYALSSVNVNNLSLQVPDALSFIWQYKEIFVDESYKFECKSEKPVIIDCGANIGLSGLYFNEQYKNAEIHCIEADPEIAKILESNLINNGAKLNIIPKAAWIDDKGVVFASEGSDSGSIDTNSTNGNTIESIDMSRFIDSFERIDFLKMDIEGAENIVIPHCKNVLSKVDKLFLEYHSKHTEEQKLPELLSILKSSGFHYYIKTENKRKTPFVNLHKERAYDLQLNIYAYRKA
jgi:FkbM family methyltransferase